ncbi:LysR family transcriptional regulator [Capillimicrobium parvum]|uniref:HTH-type transcriptional activator CmpR n=1 Tax=Capillimicrobium parvum TaxID=2884022 RepID=A0A9E7C270_9ACTN|nr:LysR family transcriptional regulator [Capillimicrobium parvum]UGS37332.1 HTH-type transcriptional activator CmpR [Capillimicrobium parvum]
MAVTLTQLHAFLAVVRRGSVTAAAAELVVTQPSVSAAVAALEREVGVELTERVGRSVRPTAAGRAYAAYAADVVGLLDQGARAAREAEDVTRTLRLSAVTTAGEYLVAPLVRAFREHRPGVEISLDVGNRGDVFQRLADHEVDVALTGRVPEDARLEGVPFADNDFVLITAPEDPLARRRWVAVEELRGRPWLIREVGSGTRTLSEEYLAAHGLDPQRLTFGSNGAIKQAVRLGLGIALQSRFAVALELELGLLASLRPRGGVPRRAWFVVRSAVGPVRPEVVDFMAFAGSNAARRALAQARPAPAG